MKANRFVALLAGALLAAGCGTGTAIFNVDIFSFLSSAQRDTITYFAPLPPGVPDTIPAQKVNVLPAGVGSSVVDSALLSGTVAFANQTGTGNIGYKLYIDTVPNVYMNGVTPKPALDSLGPVAVSGTNTTTSPFNFDIQGAAKQFFTSTQVYVGIRVVATASVAPVQGRARLTALGLRVVLQDKLF